jgi:hypothetical protein
MTRNGHPADLPARQPQTEECLERYRKIIMSVDELVLRCACRIVQDRLAELRREERR